MSNKTGIDGWRMIRRFLFWLTGRLPARMIDGDDGEPYLERYSLCGLFGVRVYIHRFVASDPDRGLHDHPWAWSLSLVLVGGYREIRPDRARFLRPWQINIIRGSDFHRILLDQGREAWTLFIHGPRTKGWGFLREGSYYLFSADKHDYRFRGWWQSAPSGRALRAHRLASLIEEAAEIIDGEALSLRQCSTIGPNFDDWTGEDDALDTYKHWKKKVVQLYAFAEHVRFGK